MENQNTTKLTGKLATIKKIWGSTECVIYEGTLEIKRDSGSIDCIPILINSNIINQCDDLKVGEFISIIGQFRSRDVTKLDGRLKVELYVYVKELELLGNIEKYENKIIVTGFVCKMPSLRTTPSGKQISDLLIACNYNKDKTAYIPTVAWGREARKSGKYSVGTEILILGRL